jgi:ATP-dependent DNA ligase
MLLCRSHPGIAYNRHFDVEGSIVFHHACKLGCEGIVSKRLGSPYRAGRSEHWIKVKNPAAPAVKRGLEHPTQLPPLTVCYSGSARTE